MKRRTVTFIAGRMFRYKGSLTLSVIFAAISGAVAIFAPRVIGLAIDNIVGPNETHFDNILKFIAILLAMYIAGACCEWLMGIFNSIAVKNVVRDLRKEAFDKISKISLSKLDKMKHGDIMSRISNDADVVAEGLTQIVTQLFTGIIAILGSLIFMFLLNYIVTLIVLAITMGAFFLASFIAKKSNKMFRMQAELTGEINSFAEESINGIRTIKINSFEEEKMKKFKQINDELYECGQMAQYYSSMVNPTTRLVNHAAYISVGIICGILALNGQMTVGSISSFLIYATQFAKPINEIASVVTQLQSALASVERLREIMEIEEEKDERGKRRLDITKGEVEFENVKFSYDPARPLIKDLSVKVDADKIVAIVGPTGAGKTTLVNLLMRFYELDSGKIKIDAEDISEVNKDSLRTSFSMVLQDTWLFKGSIFDNIVYGKPGASKEEAIRAAKAVRAHGFINRLENGYETELIENGENLSAGQRQMISIARSYLSDAHMLILDEATSSVDTRTEVNIQRAFSKMMEGRTSFVIAHRLSTIRNADIILVMKDGDIIEIGDHKQLMELNGFYNKLYNTQFAVEPA